MEALAEVARQPGWWQVQPYDMPSRLGVAIRDSKDRSRPEHTSTREERDAIVRGVEAGEFDFSTP